MVDASLILWLLMVRCEELRAAKEQANRWKAARARHVQAQEDRSVHTAGHMLGLHLAIARLMQFSKPPLPLCACFPDVDLERHFETQSWPLALRRELVLSVSGWRKTFALEGTIQGAGS